MLCNVLFQTSVFFVLHQLDRTGSIKTRCSVAAADSLNAAGTRPEPLEPRKLQTAGIPAQTPPAGRKKNPSEQKTELRDEVLDRGDPVGPLIQLLLLTTDSPTNNGRTELTINFPSMDQNKDSELNRF